MKFPEAYALSKANNDLIRFLMDAGALYSNNSCDCGSDMKFIERPDNSDGYCWRCINAKCRKRVTIRKNSFFERHKLGLGVIFMIVFCYLQFPKMLSKNIAEICGCSEQALVDWGRYIREAISHYFLRHPIVLGGTNCVVQVDESLFGGRRKYNRGDHHRHVKSWVFGIIEESTGRNVLWMVDKRNKPTLHTLIENHVARETTIKSDEWRAYSGLNEKGYTHLTVNHSINFVNSEGTHTQLIESCWSQVKTVFKQKRGTRTEDLAGYLDLFSFRSEAKFYGKTPFTFFIEKIIKAGDYY